MGDKDLDKPMGLTEVAAFMDRSKATVTRWRSNGLFPEPDLILGNRPLWFASTLMDWMKSGGHAQPDKPSAQPESGCADDSGAAQADSGPAQVDSGSAQMDSGAAQTDEPSAQVDASRKPPYRSGGLWS